MKPIGTPLSAHALRVMLLGSGELGKEVLIALQRLGVETIAVDRYADAPGHQPRPELQDHYRDVLDHVLRLSERVAAFRALLQNALAVNAALVAQRQNDEMRLLTESSFAQNEQVKRISAWAAILFAPTLIGTIYGQNFANLPGAGEPWGFALSLVLMLGVSVALFVIFKRRGWL